MYKSNPRTVDGLENRIQEVFYMIPIDFLQKSVNWIPGRKTKLVNNTGAFVEI